MNNKTFNMIKTEKIKTYYIPLLVILLVACSGRNNEKMMLKKWCIYKTIDLKTQENISPPEFGNDTSFILLKEDGTGEFYIPTIPEKEILWEIYDGNLELKSKYHTDLKLKIVTIEDKELILENNEGHGIRFYLHSH